MAEPYVDPYAVLGIERKATAGEIKAAYFSMVRAHPPEREPDRFKQVRAAYERLRDPERRVESDMLLLVEWPPPARPRRQARLDLSVHREDVITAARGFTDLERTDWREYDRKVDV